MTSVAGLEPMVARLERSTPVRQLPLPGVLVVVAAAFACFSQGAYYPRQQLLLGVVVASAVLTALLRWPLQGSDVRLAPVVGAVGLAASTLVSAFAAGDVGDAAAPVALLVGLAGTVVAVRRLDDTARASLSEALTWLGALVAASGWVAVVYRLHPYAAEDQKLWRAATTLTYANAAAGLLVPLVLLTAARRTEPSRDHAGVLPLFVLLTGLGATLSRGGFLALIAGGAVLTGAIGLRRIAAAVWAPAAGAVVALVGLLPSMPAAQSPQHALAWASVAGGAGLALVLSRLAPRRAALLFAAATGLVGALAVGSTRLVDAVPTLAASRANLTSQDRIDETMATLQLAGTRPLLGVGPGQFLLRYQADDGRGLLLARYAHNEYLQVLAVLGVVGVAVLAGGVAATVVAVFRSRRGPGDLRWAGVVAGLSAFAVHSSLDFLWHVPALPLVAAVLVGLVLRPPQPHQEKITTKETT